MINNQNNEPNLDSIKPSPPLKILKVRVNAFLEALGFFLLLVISNYFFGDGSRWAGLHLHPFWIAILIMAAHYGTLEGMVCAGLATIFLYAGNIPEQKLEQSLFEYQVQLTLIPLLWFFAAFVIGEIRSRIEYDKYNLELKAYKQSSYAQAISKDYQNLKLQYETLLSFVAGQKITIPRVFEVLRNIEKSTPSSVLQSLGPVINFALNPQKYSVYALGPEGLEIVTAEGWKENEPYLRRISTDHPIYKKVSEEKRILCVINTEDELILDKQGVLVAPLFNPETNQIFGMIKIENIKASQLNLSLINTLKMICGLIGATYSNAIKNKKVQSFLFKDPHRNVHTYHFLNYQKKFLTSLCRKLKQPLFEIILDFPGLSINHNHNDVIKILNIFNQIIENDIQMYLGKSKKLELIFLLPFIEQSKVEEYKEVLIDAFVNGQVSNDYQCETEIKCLYSPLEKVINFENSSCIKSQ